MTKYLIAAQIMALSLPVFAEYEMYPVTDPQCNVVISQPELSSGYLLNKNCTAAFVLPPKNGTIKVERLARLSNLKLCPALNNAYTKHVRYQELLDKIMERLNKDNLSPQQYEEIRKNAEFVQKAIDNLYTNFEQVPGAVTQVSYTMPATDDWVGEFLKRNPNLGADYRLKLHPAPISDSVISINSVKPAKLQPVVDAVIPGLRQINNNPNRLQGEATIMNGHTSGQLTLSLVGACDYAKAGQKDVQDLVAHMVANVTYTVPQIASVGYRASLNSNTATRNLVTAWQTRSKFSKNESSTLVATGSAGDAFTFEVTDHELGGYSDEDRQNFFAKIRDEVRTRLAARLVEQLAVAGFLEMSKPAPPANADDPGYIEEVRIRRECSSSSGFFGIGAKSSCNDIPYVVKHPTTTSAEVVSEKINNTTFTNVENVLIRAAIHRPHTTTFLPVSEVK